MHIYNSNHYSSTMKQIINDCLISAKENPFVLHYIIVDDPKYYEEIFLKQTKALFNIEIMTLSTFYQKLLQRYHQDFKQKTNLENILEIMQLNKEDPSSLFHHSLNHVLMAKEILEIFKNFYLYSLKETDKDLPRLSQDKIKTLFHLYQQFDQKHFLVHDLILSLIDEKCHDRYYFLTNQNKFSKNQEIIQKLDQYGHVFLYQDNQENKMDDYTGYVTNHLFDSLQEKSTFLHPYQLLKASTIQEEVKQVVFDINTLLSNHTLRDFAIYYPNDDYYRHLCRILDQFGFAYNKKETLVNKTFQTVMMLLRYVLSHNEEDLLDALSSYQLQGFQDFQYVSYLKNKYKSQGFIDDKAYYTLKEAVLKIQGANLTTYSFSLKTFIEASFNKSEEVYAFLSSIDLSGSETLSLKEYMNLLEEMFSPKTHFIKENYDSIYLLNYNQPYSELLGIQYIYCLGLNETIVPKEFKNTHLLLNQEALAINYPTTYDDLKEHQNDLKHLFSSHHEKIVLSYALRDLNGGDLVISSIIKKLTKLVEIPVFKKHALIHQALKENYYLCGNQDEDLLVLNHQLLTYKQTHHQVLPLQIDYQHNPLSASKLEVYNQCPYKYYLQYILKVDQINDSKIQSNEIGTLVHYVLEKNYFYFNNNQAKSFDHLKEDIHLCVQKYLNEHFQKKYALPKNQFFLKLVEDDLYNTILVLSKQMQRGLFELSVCEERVYDQIQDIELKGFIDRVDLYQNYLKVIDYKSSNKELNLDLARLGFNMQMLIYLEMLSKNKSYDKGAVLYFNTKKRMLKSDVSILEKQYPENFFKLYKMDGYSVDETYLEIDHDMEQESSVIQVKLKKDSSPYNNAKIISHNELNTLLQEITLHIQGLYQQMISGDIRIYPTRSDNPTIDMHINPCRFCHYKAICNYDIFYNEDHQIELGGKNEER